MPYILLCVSLLCGISINHNFLRHYKIKKENFNLRYTFHSSPPKSTKQTPIYEYIKQNNCNKN
jgi:hypothetical protein